ncbi:MAG: trehalose-phosphatase [bacterium]
MDDGRLPRALDRLPQIREWVGSRRPAFFLDFDGTLAPIVAHPDLAELPLPARELLSRVARSHVVCVVSGRGLEDIQRKIGLASLYYAADHGHRIVGPPGSGVVLEVGGEARGRLEAAARELVRRLSRVDGVVVEAKGLSASVHYRSVAKTDRPVVAGTFVEVAAEFPELRSTEGKLVYELRPDVPWDKGRATLWLLRRLGLGRADVCPLCLGDDLTDEDMFQAVAGWGVSVVVGDPGRPTGARYRLRDQGEAPALIQALAGHGGALDGGHGGALDGGLSHDDD